MAGFTSTEYSGEYIQVKVAIANTFPILSIDHNKNLKLALVQYYSFDATEHSIEFKPHQNAKGSGMVLYRQKKAPRKNLILLFKRLCLQQEQ